MSETPIRLELDSGHVIRGRLRDNPAARDLIEMLPLTLEFSEYGTQTSAASLASCASAGWTETCRCCAAGPAPESSRRARVTPDAAGLTVGSNRRAAGLRRSEVAALAGVSVEY